MANFTELDYLALNILGLDYLALNILGKNHLSWMFDTKIHHLNVMDLENIIRENNNVSSVQDRGKIMTFIHHHLYEGLKNEYLTIKEPFILWKSLKERYDHQQTVILPKVRCDWMHLSLQDFKAVSEYNSAMLKITSQLKLYGATVIDQGILEKIFSTFHASNVLLQQQYRENVFKKYSELIPYLLVGKQNNELLMKNLESRPPGFTPIPEVNAMMSNGHGCGYGRQRGHGCSRGRGRGRGRGYGRGRDRGRNYSWKRNDYNNNNFHKPEKKEVLLENKTFDTTCFRCGMEGHWSRTCRTPRHLVDLYQASEKGKNKIVETNYACKDGFSNTNDSFLESSTCLDVADFFGDGHMKPMDEYGNPSA